jgi:hypothetical protein
MKLSAALDLVWQLAAQEAVNAAFAAIEPEHLLEAVLKFAELPRAEFEPAGIAAALAQPLADEVGQVQAELAQRRIDSRTARRRLRVRLGRGDPPAPGPVAIHRSPASRARFAAAGDLARQQGQATTGVAHLLAALLASPTPAMVEVLGAALDAGPARPPTPSQWIAPGRDLVPLAAAGQIPAPPDRQPECTALLQMWNQPRTRGVLLIGADAATAATVAALAHALAARPAEALPPLRRLIDLRAWPAEQPDQFPEGLPELLGQAAGQDDLVLVLPAIRDEPDSAAQHAYRAVLAQTLRAESPRCLCPVEPAAYRRWLEKDMAWQRLARAMWLRPAPAAGLPSRL